MELRFLIILCIFLFLGVTGNHQQTSFHSRRNRLIGLRNQPSIATAFRNRPVRRRIQTNTNNRHSIRTNSPQTVQRNNRLPVWTNNRHQLNIRRLLENLRRQRETNQRLRLVLQGFTNRRNSQNSQISNNVNFNNFPFATPRRQTISVPTVSSPNLNARFAVIPRNLQLNILTDRNTPNLSELLKPGIRIIPAQGSFNNIPLLSSNVGDQLENLRKWENTQRLLNSVRNANILPTIPSLPSSLSFLPIVEEPFGNDPLLYVPPYNTNTLTNPTAPPTSQSALDLAIRAHLMDELGLENAVTDAPDISESKVPQQSKKTKKTRVIINPGNTANSSPSKSRIIINPSDSVNSSPAKSSKPIDNQSVKLTDTLLLLQKLVHTLTTTINPIRVVFESPKMTTPAPVLPQINPNEKLIITPTGNFTIQRSGNRNSGFAIV